MKKCPYCDEQIQDSAKKCRFCGEWLNKENVESSVLQKESVKKTTTKSKPKKIVQKIKTIKNEDSVNSEKNNFSLILGMWGVCSLIIIFMLSSIISWLLLSAGFGNLAIEIFDYIVSISYIVSIFWLTPYGIYLFIKNNNLSLNIGKEPINDKGVEYGGFWVRLFAYIIDYFLGILIIPLFFNLYYHFKDAQTIGYKAMGLKIYRVDGNTLSFPTGVQLFFYPFVKMINIITFFIGFIMIGFTEKKQGLHNLINNTVVIKIKK